MLSLTSLSHCVCVSMCVFFLMFSLHVCCHVNFSLSSLSETTIFCGSGSGLMCVIDMVTGQYTVKCVQRTMDDVARHLCLPCCILYLCLSLCVRVGECACVHFCVRACVCARAHMCAFVCAPSRLLGSAGDHVHVLSDRLVAVVQSSTYIMRTYQARDNNP